MTVKSRPEGYHTVTPYLVAEDAGALITFMTQAFGAEIREAMRTPEGRLIHAEVKIGDSIIMLGERKGDAMKAMLYLYVDDTDALYRQALAAGGTSIMEPTLQFYGDRNAAVQDACGNQWWLATHVEDVAPEEMERRAALRK